MRYLHLPVCLRVLFLPEDGDAEAEVDFGVAVECTVVNADGLHDYRDYWIHVFRQNFLHATEHEWFEGNGRKA